MFFRKILTGTAIVLGILGFSATAAFASPTSGQPSSSQNSQQQNNSQGQCGCTDNSYYCGGLEGLGNRSETLPPYTEGNCDPRLPVCHEKVTWVLTWTWNWYRHCLVPVWHPKYTEVCTFPKFT
jgi:hypothetical protein